MKLRSALPLAVLAAMLVAPGAAAGETIQFVYGDYDQRCFDRQTPTMVNIWVDNYHKVGAGLDCWDRHAADGSHEQRTAVMVDYRLNNDVTGHQYREVGLDTSINERRDGIAVYCAVYSAGWNTPGPSDVWVPCPVGEPLAAYDAYVFPRVEAAIIWADEQLVMVFDELGAAGGEADALLGAVLGEADGAAEEVFALLP